MPNWFDVYSGVDAKTMTPPSQITQFCPDVWTNNKLHFLFRWWRCRRRKSDPYNLSCNGNDKLCWVHVHKEIQKMRWVSSNLCLNFVSSLSSTAARSTFFYFERKFFFLLPLVSRNHPSSSTLFYLRRRMCLSLKQKHKKGTEKWRVLGQWTETCGCTGYLTSFFNSADEYPVYSNCIHSRVLLIPGTLTYPTNLAAL